MAGYEPKTKRNENDVYEFINAIDDRQKRGDTLEIVEIMEEATGQPPKMWGKSIVGFGSYHYKYASGQEGDWMAVGFSPRKQNLTLYIMTGFGEYADTSGYNPKPLLDKLGKYSTGKSCLYIKRLEDVDESVMRKLIKASYEYVMAKMDNPAAKE